MQAQARDAQADPMSLLMEAARTVLTTPAAAWDRRELQALALAGEDPVLAGLVDARLEQRWAATRSVVHQLRGSGAIDDAVDTQAAALHMMAVSAGLTLLRQAATAADGIDLGRWVDERSWAALSARLLESLAPEHPQIASPGRQVQYWRARTVIPDTATALPQLLRSVAMVRGQVMTVLAASPVHGEQLVDLLLGAPLDVDRVSILQAMSSVSGSASVTRGLPEDREDIATRVLERCVSLASDPDAAPQAAADLVLADSWEVVPAAEGDNATAFVLRLQWTIDRHVILRRQVIPFTVTERNRASTLLALVAALAQIRGFGEDYGWTEVLADGTVLVIRLARPQDGEAIARMHERCSEESRYQRYFTPMNAWREDNLRRIAGGHRGATLVAVTMDHAVVAVGNAFPISPDDVDCGEIAVIVDDAWHHRGIGRLMIRHLLGVAVRLQFEEVRAYVLAVNDAMLGLLDSERDSRWTTWQRFVDDDFGGAVACLRAERSAQRVDDR
jgi:GNAT superfamily N-acetyltransferase